MSRTNWSQIYYPWYRDAKVRNLLGVWFTLSNRESMAGYLPLQKLQTDWVPLLKQSQKAMLQILFLKVNNTQSLAGANRIVIQTMDFLTA